MTKAESKMRLISSIIGLNPKQESESMSRRSYIYMSTNMHAKLDAHTWWGMHTICHNHIYMELDEFYNCFMFKKIVFILKFLQYSYGPDAYVKSNKR